MTADKLSETMRNKLAFVKGLSEAVGGKVSGVESLDYVLAYRVIGNTECCVKEYLVVNYRGGAVQARNCSCNSNAAILGELAKMVYSSQVYCADTKAYQELIQSDAYDIFNVESI